MFGYQIRLLIEDLKLESTDRVEMVMENLHPGIVVQVAQHFGFTASFSEAPPIVQRNGTEDRILVRCVRGGGKHGHSRIVG